jgi:hypothetical protein
LFGDRTEVGWFLAGKLTAANESVSTARTNENRRDTDFRESECILDADERALSIVCST